MKIEGRSVLNLPMRRSFLLLVVTVVLVPCMAAAQGLTGALKGTVEDAQGAPIPGAIVRVRSRLIGGPQPQTTAQNGKFFFLTLDSGTYALEVEARGFTTYKEDIRIRPDATIQRTVLLKLPDVVKSIRVETEGSQIDEHNSGLATLWGSEVRSAIPTRRAGSIDHIRIAPGASPTSPTSGASSTTTTISIFGSGTNENKFFVDGLNTTCACNGVARADPGVDFIHEIHLQSVGASPESGNHQGGVISIITRQGTEQFRYEAAFYGQPAGLTSRPVLFPLTAPGTGQSGYERDRYGDFTTTFGGPVVHERLLFFTGYEHLRDYDSQPGTDPAFPRTYKQDKIFEKLTLKLTPRLQLDQSFHDEFFVNPDRPTQVTPFEAISRPHGSAPAMTFHLLYTLSDKTVSDVRFGRFVHSRTDDPSTGDPTLPSRFDRVTGVTSGAPPRLGSVTIMRTSAKATVSRRQTGLLGADHWLKMGVEIERGEHRTVNIIPTGVRYVDSSGQPAEAVSAPPSKIGGVFDTAGAFVNDSITVGRLTINAGVRFDHNRAFHQDLRALDSQGQETDVLVPAQGTLYTWNVWSPRLGVVLKLSAQGHTRLRASYGRFNQGVLTGELEPFHPGATPTTTRAFNPAAGDYTGAVRVVDPRINLQLDPNMRAPQTDEYSIGVDREVGRVVSLSAAYVHKDGRNFIGWTDVGGQYREETRTLDDGRNVPVFVLTNAPSARRFRLTNPDGYSLTYNGLVMVVEKRPSHGWQAFGSYTFSRTSGLQVSSGATAAGAQVSTISPPQPSLFGRDPNDLTNARGRLPNDRPHIFRVMGSVDVPHTGFTIAANLQYFSGKPWAATAQIPLPQGNLRILLEPLGSHRLSSQLPLDLRVSRKFSSGDTGRIELLVDVFNVLNDTAEEGLATDNLFSPNFGQPTLFMDPRRLMIGVRASVGR